MIHMIGLDGSFEGEVYGLSSVSESIQQEQLNAPKTWEELTTFFGAIFVY